MAHAFLTQGEEIGRLPKTCFPDHLPPSPSGDERPIEVQKPNEKPAAKAARKKTPTKPKSSNEIHYRRKRGLGPYYEFGYKKRKEPRPKF